MDLKGGKYSKDSMKNLNSISMIRLQLQFGVKLVESVLVRNSFDWIKKFAIRLI